MITVALLDTYRPKDLTDAETLELVRHLAVGVADPWSREQPLHLTSSAIVVHPPTRRILLRWHERQEAWLQVGGHADPGETDPLEIALREAREETGLTDLCPWPDKALVHLSIVPVPARGDEPAHHHADLRFVLATADPDAAVPERPEAPLRWLSVPEALELIGEDNLRETIARVEPLFSA